MYNSLTNLCLDGESVNTGIHNTLGVKMKTDAPWLSVTHCFNHKLKLAVKDRVDKIFFKDVDNLLFKLHYLHRKSPKHLRRLNIFEEIGDQSMPKPYKSYGTQWITHKIKAMEIALSNYGTYNKHLVSLNTNSQASKQAEIKGGAKKCKKC